MTAPRPTAVWLALLFLLVLTAGTSRLDLGAANVAINLAVAAAKAILILVFFMHLKAGAALPRLAAGVAALWIAILYALTTVDYLSR